MSDIIPPILSSTPPPLADIADDDDDFGDFAVADDPFQTDIEPEKDVNWIEDGSKKITDNTSQDSVLSGNTDSGLCSDSSPLPVSDTNCDQQPVKCDVPLSDLNITQAQCDLPKTSTKTSETGCIPLERESVNSEVGVLNLEIVSQLCNGNLETSIDPQDLQTAGNLNEEHSVKSEEFDAIDKNFSSVGSKQFDITDCIQNLNEGFKPESESNFELNWNGIDEQSLNDVNSNLSKELSKSQEENIESVQSENLDEDKILSTDEFNTSSELVLEDLPKLNQISDTELEVVEEEIPTFETFQPSEDTVQNSCDVPAAAVKDEIDICREEPPEIPPDLDLEVEEKDDLCFPDISGTEDGFDGFPETIPSSRSSIEPDLGQVEMENFEVESFKEDGQDFDNFGDFAEAAEFKAFDENDAEFGAFGDSTAATDDENWALPEEQMQPKKLADDDFGDFEEADDTFGQFEESSAGEISSFSEEAVESEIKFDDLFSQPGKLKEALETIFDCDSPLGSPKALTPLSSHLKHLWPEIQDVQNTPALEFQWNNSGSHELLLSALGIDTRNILFGHQLNSSMPRFAANLGQSPLEPVKAADVSNPANPAVPEIDGVPAAQFDWNGSGLVNPLDCETRAIKKVMSAAAQKVLSSLPDLSFMRVASLSRPQF